MELLARIYLGNTLHEWLLAMGTAFGVLLLLRLTQRVGFRRLSVLAKRTETDLDDLLIDVLYRTRWFALLAVSIYAGTRLLRSSPGVERFIHAILFLALLLQVTLWSNAAISLVIQRMVQKRMEGDAAKATALSVLGFAAKVALWSVFLMLGLDNLGINVTGLVAGLGIGGLAVAFALQTILGDLFASLSIVLDSPFAIGDFLVVGEVMGTVEHIGLKTTRLRSLSGEQIVFPNGELLKSRIRNFQHLSERRIAFNLGVTYQTTQKQLQSIGPMIRGSVDAQPGVRFDRAHLTAFGDSDLTFEIVYFVLSPDYNTYRDAHQAILLEVVRQFASAGIDFAYPTRTLHLSHDPAGATVPGNP
ncbi:MAG: mechanosensitive ion channel family protein [Acidobacteria bacterium]|nr:mechanosensitive ion channel family protein [Acidobacteriota bacterium]